MIKIIIIIIIIIIIKSIEWKKMATVAVPSEFSETVKVGTSDIKTLPPTAQNFQQGLSGKLDEAGKNLQLDELQASG